MDGRLGDEKTEPLADGGKSQKSRLGARYVGEVLAGTYRIARRIGSGGMADVYEVEHLRLGSRFAAKVLRPREGTEPSVRRFVREARLLANLKSEHIVTVFDVNGADEETPFYVMELLNGHDLRKLLATAQELSVARAVKIISDACLGLSAAHAAGLVHRDLKPENLFVTHRDSGEEICKLLDFGVAKADGGTSTEHGGLIGTVRYMAPEQIAHAGTVSPRADVRGLGAILYECLAGRPPHVADSLERLLFQVLNDPIEPIRTHRPAIPAELDDIVLRALERDAAKRFPSAAAFAEALRPFAAGLVGGGSVATERTLLDDAARPAPKVGPKRGTRRVVLGALGAGAGALVTCLLVLGRPDTTGASPITEVTRRPAHGVQGRATDPPNVPKLAFVAPEAQAAPVAAPPAEAARPEPLASTVPRRKPIPPPPKPARSNPEEPHVTPLVRIESHNPYAPDAIGTARFATE